jgi:uncharacterized membrane protein YfcA
MPELAAWQWLLGVLSAFVIGVSKTGAPGAGTLVAPLMIMTVGDARHAAAWTAPILSIADVFAVVYWRRHADVGKLFSLVPWVLAGMAGGAAALSLSEPVLRRLVGGVVVFMLAVHVLRRLYPSSEVVRGSALYGVTAGFASTVANAASPVMNLYLLSRHLAKEQFVATGAWFFFVINLSKVPIYAWYRLYSSKSLLFDALLAPAVVVGAFGGLWLVRRVSQRLFDILVVALTVISTVFLFR